MQSMKNIFILLILTLVFEKSLSQSTETQAGVRKFLFIQQETQTDGQQQVVDPTNQQDNATQNVQSDPNLPDAPIQQVAPQDQNTTQQAVPVEKKEEKNLMYVIPFSKEQFEAEMKLQSLKLQDDSKKYFEQNLQTLKNITIENRKIIEQKKKIIKLYLNHTMIYLDSQIQVLQRELEQNHEIIIQLASAIMLTTLDDYEQKIASFKLQIQDLLVKIDPPKTLCKKIMSCQSCAAQQDCVWSTDRRACFVGSKYDGCYFDFCEFFIKDNCISNALIDRVEQDQLDHYTEDEYLAQIMDELYDEEDVEIAAQRIPQPQKNYQLQLQNKLIGLKDKIQRARIYINYIKKIYFKLRYQNIIFKRKRKQQKEEDLKFIQEIEKNEESFLKGIKETEEEKKINIDDIIKNEKALEIAARKGQPSPVGEEKDEKLIIGKNGQITLSNGQVIEGLLIIDGKVFDQITGEERIDLKVVNGQLVGENGKPITASELQNKLEEEQGFIDGLLSNWFGDEYEAPTKTTLSEQDKKLLEKEKDETIIDVDAEEIQNEEQTILEYISDQMERENDENN